MIQLKTITSDSEIILPDSFECPICDAKIYVSEVSAWQQEDDGTWTAEAVKIDCVTSPDYGTSEDEDEMDSFLRSHWSMPYVDWLPLEKRVTDWVNQRYRWNLN